MDAEQLVRDSTRELLDGGIEQAKLDAEIIIAHVLDVERWKLLAYPERSVSDEQLQVIKGDIERRLSFEPVAYITGRKEFYSLEFTVNHDVLIPRPETELLVDLAIYYLKPHDSLLDIGTGSGAIAVAVKYNRSDAVVFASDISDKALAIARQNAEDILGSDIISFYHGDLFAPFGNKKFDCIVANPPYINPGCHALQKELAYEPREALFCDREGRSLTERLVVESGTYLNDAGLLIIEIGFDMKAFIKRVGERENFSVTVMADYAGHPRIALMEKRR